MAILMTVVSVVVLGVGNAISRAKADDFVSSSEVTSYVGENADPNLCPVEHGGGDGLNVLAQLLPWLFPSSNGTRQLVDTQHIVQVNYLFIDETVPLDGVPASEGLTIDGFYEKGNWPSAFLCQTSSITTLYDGISDDYYVGLMDVSGFNKMSGHVLDAVFARNNTFGQVLDGVIYDYENGIAYVPKTTFLNENGVEIANPIQTQMLVGISGVHAPQTVTHVETLSLRDDVQAYGVSDITTSDWLGSMDIPVVAPQDADKISLSDLSVYVDGTTVALNLMEGDNASYNQATGCLTMDIDTQALSGLRVIIGGSLMSNFMPTTAQAIEISQMTMYPFGKLQGDVAQTLANQIGVQQGYWGRYASDLNNNMGGSYFDTTQYSSDGNDDNPYNVPGVADNNWHEGGSKKGAALSSLYYDDDGRNIGQSNGIEWATKSWNEIKGELVNPRYYWQWMEIPLTKSGITNLTGITGYGGATTAHVNNCPDHADGDILLPAVCAHATVSSGTEASAAYVDMYMKVLAADLNSDTPSVVISFYTDHGNSYSLGDGYTLQRACMAYRFAVDAPIRIRTEKTNSKTNTTVRKGGFKFALWQGDTKLSEAETNGDGIAEFDINLQAGTYTIKEIATQEPFNPNTGTQSITVSAQGDHMSGGKYYWTQQFPNEPYAYIKVLKLSAATNRIIPQEGFSFDLYASDKTTKLSSATTDNTGTAIFKDSSNNPLKLAYGTYWVKETAAPIPWDFDDDFVEVPITAAAGDDGARGDIQGGYDDVTAGIKNVAHVSKSDKQHAYIKVIKKNKETGEIVTEAGFKFNLYKEDGTTLITTGTTDATGTVIFDEQLEVPGTYVVKEIEVPKPWVKTTDTFTIPLEADGETGKVKSGSQSAHDGGPDGAGVYNVIDNPVANAPQYGCVTLTKKDIKDNQLQDDAEFKVILLDNKVEYTAQGGADRLPEAASPKYPISKLTNPGHGSSTFNEENGEVTVTNPVVFLTDENGGTTDILTTSNGTLTTGWLPIDKSGTSHYALVEVQASNGHLIKGTQIPFTLTYDASKTNVDAPAVSQEEQPNEIELLKKAKDPKDGKDTIQGATLGFWTKANNLVVEPDAGFDGYVLRTPNDSLVPHAYYRIDGAEINGAGIYTDHVVHLVKEDDPDIVIDLESGVVKHAKIGTYTLSLYRKSDNKALVYTGPSSIEVKDGSAVNISTSLQAFSGKNEMTAQVGEVDAREAVMSWDPNNNAWITKRMKPGSIYQIEIGDRVVKEIATSETGGEVWMGRYAETDSRWFADHYVDQGAMPKNDNQIILKKTLSGKEYTYETVTDDGGTIVWERLPFGEYVLAEVKPAVDQQKHESWLVDTTVHRFLVNSTTGYIKDLNKEGDTFTKTKAFSFTDDKTTLYISKKDLAGSDEIPGAELVLTADNNDVVDKWTSTDEPHLIEYLKPGTYVLTEYMTPKDYDKAESITINVLPTSEIQSHAMLDKPISIEAEIDKRQEIAKPLDERYEAKHEENNADEQTNESGLYSYSLDFKSNSNTWTDEFTVEDPMEPANDGYAKLVTLVTPQAFQDYDGLMNVWYKTNKTPADYVEQSADSTAKTDSKGKTETETETGTNTNAGTDTNTGTNTGTGTETGDGNETETEVEPPAPMSQVPSMEAKDGTEVTVNEADEKVLSNVDVSISGVSVGKLQPKVGSYKVSFLTVAELLRSSAPDLTGFKIETSTETETDSEAGSDDETGTGSETGTSTETEDEWTWTVDGSLNEEATAKTYTLTIKHDSATYTYTFDYVVPEGIEGNPRSLLKGVYNATLSDGHVNPWLDDKDAMAADEDGDKRIISYKGWKIWEEGVDVAVSKRLDVADLKLDDDEYITGIRFEYGRVEVGFKTRVEDWDRALRYDLHDDVNSITAASGDSFDDPNESVKASASRLEQVAKRFTTDASRELEEQAKQVRKQAERDYAQKLIDVETYNSRLAEYAEGTLPKFAEALTLPAYDGDADSIDELHAAVDATKISIAAAFALGDTPAGRVAIYEAAETVWSTDVNNGYVSQETSAELEKALLAYSVAMDKVPVPAGAADMHRASEKLLNVLMKAIDEIALKGLSGRIPYAPAVLQMRLTDKYVPDVVMKNSAKVDAYRNGGNGDDSKEGKLEGHDRDEVQQRPSKKDIRIGTKLASPSGERFMTSDGSYAITLVDTVEYYNLVPGHEYVMRGSLRKKNIAKDGTVTDGGPVGGSAGETKFKATEKNGTVTVKLTVPVGADNIVPVVAFEELYPVVPDTGKPADHTLAEHKDINDEGQTVRMTAPAADLVKTGDSLWPVVAILASGAVATTVYVRRKNEA